MIEKRQQTINMKLLKIDNIEYTIENRKQRIDHRHQTIDNKQYSIDKEKRQQKTDSNNVQLTIDN